MLVVPLFENPFSMSFDTYYVLLNCCFHPYEPALRSCCSGYLKGHLIQVSFLKLLKGCERLFFSSKELLLIAKHIFIVCYFPELLQHLSFNLVFLHSMSASPAFAGAEVGCVTPGPLQSWWAPQGLLHFWNLHGLWSLAAIWVPVELRGS